MKTILYQPLFINPQAYFVFPQLYHIEKGDSYIEPANITGQLIINDLTKVLTSTPTLNVVQDTNQVDFGLFKGKHIRISQYTNIGAVVLGEWYIPGTPTPPEPEQPDWFKESIVAWYSPCKQKLSNYDVIESYNEDFTDNNWKHTNNVTVSNNSFHLTYGNLTYELYPIRDYNTKPMTVIVKGMTGTIGFIRYRYGVNNNYVDIKKDGVYYLPAKVDDVTVLGFQTHFKSECNITITQLPTSILKDFSGNKHDAYLYGFKGKLNSGVGIYAQDFKNWSYGSTVNNNISTKSYNKFHIVKKKADNWFGFTIGIPKTNYYNQSYKLKFTINKKIDDIKFSVVSTDGNLKTTNVYSVKINDGSMIDIPVISEEIFNNKEESNIYYDFGTNKDIEIDVELIANYPNQLCYDGKSYAVAYGLPILTDYTVIADRTWFNYIQRACFLSKVLHAGKGAFGFEIFNEKNEYGTYSFGTFNDVAEFDKNIVYQTKKSYNGRKSLIHGPVSITDYDELYLGKLRSNENNMFIGCHGDILLFNRTLTEYEISWVKNNVMCSKQQEPDIDL